MKELVKKAKKGDDGAFYELIQQHKIQLYRMAMSYLKNENDAVEAVQEVTYRAYRSLKKLKQPTYFSTWLIRILLNYCHDEVNKRKRLIVTDELIQYIGVTSESSQLEIVDALEKIDERYREVITLKYFHDLKIKEISFVLQRPEGTVKTWLHKGLQAMREQLTEKGGDRHA